MPDTGQGQLSEEPWAVLRKKMLDVRGPLQARAPSAILTHAELVAHAYQVKDVDTAVAVDVAAG